MAIATYATDLQTFELFEASADIGEFVGYIAASKPTNPDGDNPIQGDYHVSVEQRTAALGSIAVDYGAPIAWTSGWGIFVWGAFLQAGAVNTDALGGIVMMIGEDESNFWKWTVGGSDFGRAPYGGYQNWVCDPEVTTGRTETGTMGTNYQWAGFGCDVQNAISKGSPYNIDAIRFGRGELRVINGQPAAYGTFEDMAGENDLNANMWGLFQASAGSYLWKGLISLGTTTSVDFRDSNRVIVIDNTRRVQSDFNRIEINHASSNIEWTNISISALGTTAKGELEMIDNATFVDIGGVFADMGTFVYQSNATITGRTFRRCGQITGGTATFTNCVFDSSTAASTLSETTLANLTTCTFISDGSNHAVNLGTVASSPTWVWNHLLVGYAASDGILGNEAIRIVVNSPNVVTINVAVGASTPSVYHTGTGTVTVNSGVLVEVLVTNDVGIAIENARVHLRASDATGDLPFKAAITDIISAGTTATVTTTDTIETLGIESNDKVLIIGTAATEIEYTGVFQITVTDTSKFTYTMSDTAASPASGTTTLTFVAVDGLTNIDGEISSSRDFTADQPIIGWARKSTTSPYYKEGIIVGDISYLSGLSKSAVLVSDE